MAYCIVKNIALEQDFRIYSNSSPDTSFETYVNLFNSLKTVGSLVWKWEAAIDAFIQMRQSLHNKCKAHTQSLTNVSEPVQVLASQDCCYTASNWEVRVAYPSLLPISGIYYI